MGKPARAPRGKAVNLKAEVEWWLKLERELKAKWGPSLAQIEATRGPWPIRTPSPAMQSYAKQAA